MVSLVFGCSNSFALAKAIAARLKGQFARLIIKSFPDGEMYVRFGKAVKGANLVLVQSLYPNPSTALLELYFAGRTAQRLGATVLLVVPYLAYMRQDKEFRPGECISSRCMAEMLSSAGDALLTIDPHLHRYKSLKEIFKIPTKALTAAPALADWIKANLKDEIIIGPDIESYQWAEGIAQRLRLHAIVLRKRRWTATKVAIRAIEKIPIGKNLVIVDDVISTGRTVIEAAKQLQPYKPKSITAVATHGIFAGDALRLLKRSGISAITTNSIQNPAAKIDISGLLAEGIRNYF